MVTILSRAKPEFLILALLLAGLWITNMGLSYSVAYRLVGLKESLGHMIVLSSAAINFLGVIAPSAGISSLALFISDGKEKGHPSARVTIACMFYILFDYFGLFLTALAGLLILLHRDKLGWAEIAATCFLGLIVAGLVLLLYLSIKHLDRLKKFLSWVINAINSVIHLVAKKTSINEAQMIHFAEEIRLGAQAIQDDYRRLLIPVFLALTNKALLILILAMLFLGFGFPVDWGIVVSGFTLGNLFTIVSPTPSGIGVVEGMMTLALEMLGIEIEAATILTLSFRAISFWIPFFVGMIAFRALSSRRGAVSST